MLEICTPKECELGNHEAFTERNVSHLKQELYDLVEYKIDTATKEWYRSIYIGYLIDIDTLSGNGNIKGIDKIPQGFISELFFLNACQQIGIECEPSRGDDDIIGIDFRIKDNKETRFFDICINSNKNFLDENLIEGRFPVLFVPWRNRDWGMSYAEAYVRYGCFNGRRFLERTVQKNEEILFKLEEDRKRKMYPTVYGKKNVGLYFPQADTQYYNDFKGTLSLLKRSLFKN